MIRPLTVLGCVAFLGAGFHVYQTKAQVDDLGQELRRVLQATEAERVRSRTLSAEWARLNDQDRLSLLATTHLADLQPTAPQQFVRVADAGRRLPGATAFAGQMNGFSARADAPSAPGEVLVFSARTMMAQAAPVRAAMPAEAAPVEPAPVEPAALPAAQPAAPPPPVVARATERPSPPVQPPVQPSQAASARVVAAAAQPPRPAPRQPVAVARAAPQPNLRTALHVTAAPQAQPAPARVAPSRASPPRAAAYRDPTNFAAPLGFVGGSVTDAMASSVLMGGGSLPPPAAFGP